MWYAFEEDDDYFFAVEMFYSPDGPVYCFEEVVDNFFGGISFLDCLVDLISE